jgi:hypothetical protein
MVFQTRYATFSESGEKHDADHQGDALRSMLLGPLGLNHADSIGKRSGEPYNLRINSLP